MHSAAPPAPDTTPDTTPDPGAPCLCGSGNRFGDCCGPRLAGARPADTPEALMRSRYCAFVLGDAAYLLTSWHPRTRPATLDLHDQPPWRRLEVLGAGLSDDANGWVEFAAHYHGPAGSGSLRERSRFVCEQGRWLYLDGSQPPSAQASPRPGRNEPCPCGSGRKFKHCCGR